MSIPAGWYPDPAPASTPQRLLRWWDGTQWTGHVQPAYPQAVAPVGPTTPDGQPLAGRGWRLLAYLLDNFATGVVSGLVTLPVQIDVQRELFDRQLDFQRQLEGGATPSFGVFLRDLTDVYLDHAWGLLVAPALVALLYHVGFLRWRGATPGKLVCGLRVRRLSEPGTLPWSAIGSRVGIEFFLPWLALVLGLASGSLPVLLAAYLVATVVGLVDVAMVFGQQRRTLHDRAAGTVVVVAGGQVDRSR